MNRKRIMSFLENYIITQK